MEVVGCLLAVLGVAEAEPKGLVGDNVWQARELHAILGPLTATSWWAQSMDGQMGGPARARFGLAHLGTARLGTNSNRAMPYRPTDLPCGLGTAR